ncbi:MAG: NUDIX domain-containing protein [Candidatus Omnitrophica bacterium]|nr:NUDIX domain-containing protein [Candidatus Omnitrophota bacterium]
MKIYNTDIEIIRNDITELEVDAVVVSVNDQMIMDDGLAKQISEKAGEVVIKEARKKAPVPVGEVIWTNAGDLRANYILHVATVKKGSVVDQVGLRTAIRNMLECAHDIKAISLAIPALGCGKGRFPLIGCAKIITQEILKFLKKPDRHLCEIFICLRDEETFKVFDYTITGYVKHMYENLGPGPYVTVDVIIEYKDSIVIVERFNPPYGWALPGGFLDHGESLEQAAIREVKEETNLDLENLTQYHTFSDPARDPRFHTITTVYTGKGIGDPIAGDDAKSLKFIREKDLPDLDFAFDHKQIIRDYFQNRK